MIFHTSILPGFAGIAISCAALLGCTIPADTSRVIGENSTVASARRELVGLDEDDIRMCAGFPTASSPTADGGTIWAYRRDMPRGSWNVVNPSITLFGAIPAVNTSRSVASGGSCSTQFRFVERTLRQVEFAGDNNTPTDLNGLCVSMIDNCVAYVRRQKSN